MSQIDLSWLQMDAWLIATLIVCVVAFVAVTIIWGRQAHQRRIAAGWEELIGRTAEVRTALSPKGTVFVEGEQWTAISETGRVEPGEEVIISKVDGLKLYVTSKQERR